MRQTAGKIGAQLGRTLAQAAGSVRILCSEQGMGRITLLWAHPCVACRLALPFILVRTRGPFLPVHGHCAW